jgi:lysyl-tRNA synthetase class II
MKKGIIATIVGVALICGLIALGSTRLTPTLGATATPADTATTDTTTTADPAPVEVFATEIIAEYDVEPAKAESTYKGNKITVHGQLTDSGTVLGMAYITIGDETTIRQVQCMITDPTEIAKIASMKKGDIVSINGTVGSTGSNVLLENCTINF